MSRSISIGYRQSEGDKYTDIEVSAPYFLLGTQQTSKAFWALPRLREIGLKQLPRLGITDPVSFVGWEMLGELWQEIWLLQAHLSEIEFDAEIKASWVAHLVYCYSLLILTAPRDSIPELDIG